MPLTRNDVRRLFAFAGDVVDKRVYVLFIAFSLSHFGRPFLRTAFHRGYFIGSGLVAGFVPTLSTAYAQGVSPAASADYTESGFPSDSEDVVCVDRPEGKEPPRTCKEAHSIVVFLDALKLSVARIVLSVLSAAYIEARSDRYGRKAFIIVAFLSTVLSPLLLLLHLEAEIPFYWYYVGKAVELSLTLPSLYRQYIRDAIEEAAADMAHLAFLFVSAAASFCGAFCVATSVVTIARDAVLANLATASVSTLVCLIFLPNPPATGVVDVPCADFRAVFEAHWLRPFRELYDSFVVDFRGDALKYTLIVYFLFEWVYQRDSELELQYLQDVAGFGTTEQSTYLMIRFLMTAFVLAVWFPLWSLIWQRTFKDAFGLVMVLLSAKLFGMVFVESKALAYGLELCGTVDVLFTLIVDRVVEHLDRSRESRASRLAVRRVRAVAQGLSPLFHATLFVLFRHAWGYFPGAPFLALFCAAAVGFLLVLQIRVQSYGFVTPGSTFLRIVTLTFASDDDDLEGYMYLPVSGRGYQSEEDTNHSPSDRETSGNDASPPVIGTAL